MRSDSGLGWAGPGPQKLLMSWQSSAINKDRPVLLCFSFFLPLPLKAEVGGYSYYTNVCERSFVRVDLNQKPLIKSDSSSSSSFSFLSSTLPHPPPPTKNSSTVFDVSTSSSSMTTTRRNSPPPPPPTERHQKIREDERKEKKRIDSKKDNAAEEWRNQPDELSHR